jgi:uncharacterized membrane protein HdeD (DUF308 family)
MNSNTVPSSGRLKTLGFISIALGVIALASPVVAAGAVVMVVGITMAIAGISQIYYGFQGETWRDKVMPIVLGALTLLGGLYVLGNPLFGASLLSLMIALYFFVEGIWKVIAAFKFRPDPGWVWFLIGGLITVVLGCLIWNQWPLAGILAIGILVGIDLLMTGVTLVMFGSAVKSQSG